MVVLIAVFGLSPLIGLPEPTITVTNTEGLKTFTPISLSKISTQVITPIPASKTPVLTVTPTKILASDNNLDGACDTTLVIDTELYEIPAAKRIQIVGAGKVVSVIGILDSEGWYMVRTEDQSQGWIKANLVSNLGECIPKKFSISEAVISENENLVFQDNFNENTQLVIPREGKHEFIKLENGESVLHLDDSFNARQISVPVPYDSKFGGGDIFRMVFALD